MSEKKTSSLQSELGFEDPPFGPKKALWSSQVPDIAKSSDHEKYPSGYIIDPPSGNSGEIYNKRSKDYPYQEINLKEKWTQLPPVGLGDDCKESLEKMENYYNYQRQQFLGYQCVEQLNISKEISPFLNMSLNNIGDPFTDGYFTLNAKQAERGVLDFYASIWHAQWPSLPKPEREPDIDDNEYLALEAYEKYKESYWGYILSMGSTEGNLYAVLSGRDYLSGFSLVVDDEGEEEALCLPELESENPNKYIPVAFYSEAAHYSLAKAVHAMQVKTFYQIANENDVTKEPWICPLGGNWPESVPINKDGSVDVEALVTLVNFFAEKGHPPFICFNYGTTFKGAYDDIPKACEKLNPVFEKYGLIEREVDYYDSEGNKKTDLRRGDWVHVDGALAASLMPFVEMSVEHGRTNKEDLAPCFDFRNDEVMSIVTSGHKWASAPAPTGVYMTRNKYLITPVATPDYLGSADTTFAGSRTGLSAMVLWNLIAKRGIPGLVENAERTMELCAYTQQKIEELQNELGDFNIWFQRAPHGGTSFIFRKPKDEIMYKYSLPIEVEVIDNGTERIKRTYVHLFIFWDRDEAMIDSLFKELDSKEAFDPEAEKISVKVEKNKLAATKPVRLLRRSLHKGFR